MVQKRKVEREQSGTFCVPTSEHIVLYTFLKIMSAVFGLQRVPILQKWGCNIAGEITGTYVQTGPIQTRPEKM